MKLKSFIVLGLVSLSVTVAKPARAGGYYITNMDLFAQEQSMWCWAAVTQSVLKQVGAGSVAQCRMATYFLTNGPDSEYCCKSYGSYSPCNQGYHTQNAIYAYRAMDTYYTGQLNQTSIINEVKGGYPVVFHIRYADLHAHAALFYGATYENELYIWDPGNGGDKYVRSRYQAENYDGGVWYETVTTKRVN